MALFGQGRWVDRIEAGARLANALMPFQGQHPLVLAMPRGGVPVGRVIADRLGGELDVVLVHELLAPGQRMPAIGTIDESGTLRIVDPAARNSIDMPYLRQEAARQLQRIRERRRQYSPHRTRIDPESRIVIVVGDGQASNAIMAAALRAVRQQMPLRLICAIPQAPASTLGTLRSLADNVVCLPSLVSAYDGASTCGVLSEVDDEDVVRLLARRGPAVPPETDLAETLRFPVDGQNLVGDVYVPPHARGLVVFAHGMGSGRLSPRNRHVATLLHQHGIATLLFDLLGAGEEAEPVVGRIDVARLAHRLDEVVQSLRHDSPFGRLPFGLFGAGTGAAVALRAASRHGDSIRAAVLRGGRPELAGSAALGQMRAPTLLIVGGEDLPLVASNRHALDALRTYAELAVVPRAGHLFMEPGALGRLAALAADWFVRWL